MKKLRLAAISVLALGTLAAFSPAALAAHHEARQASHHGTVSGKLQSYTAGISAVLSTGNHKTLKVGLSFHTKLQYTGKKNAAPFPAKGDAVSASVSWNKSGAKAVSLSYAEKGNQGSTQSDGTDDDGNSRFEGAYVAASSSSTVLAIKDEAGNTDNFTLTANTVYYVNGQLVANPTLTDGEKLWVEATQQTDGSWVADTVVIGDHHGDHGGVGQSNDFGGVYQSNTATTLTISEEDGSDAMTFTVDANTQYFDQTGAAVSSITYAAGMRLHVDATEQSDGTWLATKVSVRQGHQDGEGDNHHFRGTYMAADQGAAGTLTLLDEAGNPETFTVNSSTQYFDASGNPVASLTFSDGEAVYVTAAKQADGTWLATEVSLKAPDGHDGHGDNQDFGGTYQSNTANTLVLTDEGGFTLTFTVDANTQYFDQSGNSVPSLTYTTGERLHVVATQQSDGTWLATVVSAFDGNGDNNTEGFHGNYQSSTGTQLVLMGEDNSTLTFTLDANTQYFDQNGNPVSSLTYTSNEPLHVKATKQSDGTWLANEVSAQTWSD